MDFPEVPPATAKAIADHLLATAREKKSKQIAARLIELAELGDPIINGRTRQIDGQASPHSSIKDILTALAIARGLPDTDPDEVVIDATLEEEAIPFRVELDRWRGNEFVPLGVAVLRGVHTVFGQRRVIAIYHVAKEQACRAMRALNEF